MARISRSSRFKRNYKKLMRKHYDMGKIDKAIILLAKERFDILKENYDDHQLKGEWKNYRAIHIESNWILIYKKSYDTQIELLTINLEATGNHEEYDK